MVARVLLQQLGIEALINFVLMGGVSIGLERGDQGTETRRENDQVASIGCSGIRVGKASGYEYCPSGTDGLLAVTIAEDELTLQNMPRFVVGVVDMEHGGAAAAPFMN